MRAKTWLILAGLFLVICGLQASAFAAPLGGGRGFDRDDHAEVHEGFRGGFAPRVFVGPAFGFGWGWDYPWFWGPYSYYAGPNVVEQYDVNYGTVELKVRPDSTKVYVDQKFFGRVKDLDHHKLYLSAGNHEIKLESPDGQTMDRTIYVAAGKKVKIDENL